MDERELGLILLAAQGWSELFSRAMSSGKPAGVTAKTQIDVLVSLSLNGPQNMGALSERLERAPEQISRAVKTLRECGLVACERNPENHRIIVASLTERGAAELKTYLDSMHEFVSSYLAQLSKPQRRWLLATAKETLAVMGEHPVPAAS